MFLNNIMADQDRTARLIEIAQSSLQPLLEGAILYTIPLTFITFICGLILAVLTALARLSSVKIPSNHCESLCFSHKRNPFIGAIIHYILWAANDWDYHRPISHQRSLAFL